jgi:hypothetical protein
MNPLARTIVLEEGFPTSTQNSNIQISISFLSDPAKWEEKELVIIPGATPSQYTPAALRMPDH